MSNPKHSSGFGNVEFIKPVNPRITPWIKGYYVHTSEDPNFFSKLTFYQNITTTISIYRDSKTTSSRRTRTQTHQAGLGFHSLLVGLVDKYQEVEFYGPLDRIAVVFHPGGLNQFIDVPLSKLLATHYSDFIHYEHHFADFLPVLFDETSLEEKRNLLDAFFSDRLIGFDEPTVLTTIETMISADESMKVSELASLVNVSRRTLLRKFKRHLGYSIEEYAATIKFRRALLNYQQQNPLVNLTEIALDSNYYDQADFNHQMKQRSGLTPKELFRRLNIVDGTLFWKV